MLVLSCGSVPAGLPAEQRVHHNTESFARHHKGLLEDDMGPQHPGRCVFARDAVRRGEELSFFISNHIFDRIWCDYFSFRMCSKLVVCHLRFFAKSVHTKLNS